MAIRKSKAVEIAPVILKIHHFINNNIEFPDLEREHGSLKYNEKHYCQEYINALDRILGFLGEAETSMEDEVRRFERDWEFSSTQIKEKVRLMKRAIKLLGSK